MPDCYSLSPLLPPLDSYCCLASSRALRQQDYVDYIQTGLKSTVHRYDIRYVRIRHTTIIRVNHGSRRHPMVASYCHIVNYESLLMKADEHPEDTHSDHIVGGHKQRPWSTGPIIQYRFFFNPGTIVKQGNEQRMYGAIYETIHGHMVPYRVPYHHMYIVLSIGQGYSSILPPFC